MFFLKKKKSQFLIPSTTFPKTEGERYLLITQYRQELANTECRRLRITNYKFCPYGDNCKLNNLHRFYDIYY